MAKHVFTARERYAIFTVHGETCYLCNRPVTLSTMQVDHVIPESLLRNPDRLRQVLLALGRPESFEINSYENWMPACAPCNRRKSDTVFDPSPIIQVVLQRAAERALHARELEEQAVTEKTLARALNDLERFAGDRPLDQEMQERLRPLLGVGDALRTPERKGKPLSVAPLLTILWEKGGVTVVTGPYGTGGGPTDPSPAMRCPSCGGQYFSGARCVLCGALDDD